MPGYDRRHAVWERRQTELWDRIFHVTQNVVTLAQSWHDPHTSGGGPHVLRDELLKSAMAVGVHLVRANAADSAERFEHHVREARLQAIETDYWLRLSYVLQQHDDVQRELSTIIAQYASIIALLQQFLRHTKTEPHVLRHHAKGPLVS
jgi:four helix bundle protein